MVFDDIGKHFLDNAVELMKAGMKFVYVIDNIDWEERVHDMREHHQNKNVHAVATSMVFSRISSDQLPDDGPQKDVKTCNFREIVSVGDEEMNTYSKATTGSFLSISYCWMAYEKKFLEGI